MVDDGSNEGSIKWVLLSFELEFGIAILGFDNY